MTDYGKAETTWRILNTSVFIPPSYPDGLPDRMRWVFDAPRTPERRTVQP